MHDEVRALTSFNLTIGFKRKFQFSGGHSQIIWRRFMTKRVGNWQSVPKPGFYPPSSEETREKATQLQAGVSGESWPLDWVSVHQVLTGYMWVVANPGLGENITGHFGGVQSECEHQDVADEETEARVWLIWRRPYTQPSAKVRFGSGIRLQF